MEQIDSPIKEIREHSRNQNASALIKIRLENTAIKRSSSSPKLSPQPLHLISEQEPNVALTICAQEALCTAPVVIRQQPLPKIEKRGDVAAVETLGFLLQSCSVKDGGTPKTLYQ